MNRGQELVLAASAWRPTWSWDFKRGYAPPGATFTRASSGWYFNSAGVLTQAAGNVARFDYDPATLQPLGYLAEMQSTNSVPYSSDRAQWVKTGTTVSTDGTTGPDGALATLVATAAGAGNHYSGMGQSGGGGSSVLGLSVFVKQGSTRYVCLYETQDSISHTATFDFSTGAFVNGGENVLSTFKRPLANGWWRLGFTLQLTSTGTATNLVVSPTTKSTGTNVDKNYTASGTETVYAHHFQNESGGVGITSVIPTSGSTVTRAADSLSLPLSSVAGWDATKGGVLVAAYRLHTLNPPSPGYNQSPVYLNDGSINNVVLMMADRGGAGTFGGYLGNLGGSFINIDAGTASAAFVRRKQALGWGANKLFVAYDGLALQNNTNTVALPTVTTMNLGLYAGGAALNGTLESIAYYKGARPDGFVQGVSR